MLPERDPREEREARPEPDARLELSALVLFALGGLVFGYTTMARYERNAALAADVEDGEPVPATLDAHARVDRVAADVRTLLAQVEGFHADHGRWPQRGDLKQPVPLAYSDLGAVVRRYEISEDGHVRVVLAGPGLDGRALVFTPRLGPNRVLDWSCRAPAELVAWLGPACPD